MYFIRFVLSFGFLFAFSSCLIGFFLLGDIYYGDFIDDIANICCIIPRPTYIYFLLFDSIYIYYFDIIFFNN